MKEFKGRVLAGGEKTLEAVVSRGGMNTLATFQKSALMSAKQTVAADQNNPDLFGKNITGKALCLPITIGSTTGGLVLQTACSMGIAPAALLFSEHIDSLAASGVALAVIWENSDLIAIDQLGEEFLNTVQTGDQLEIRADGTVAILD